MTARRRGAGTAQARKRTAAETELRRRLTEVQDKIEASRGRAREQLSVREATDQALAAERDLQLQLAGREQELLELLGEAPPAVQRDPEKPSANGTDPDAVEAERKGK